MPSYVWPCQRCQLPDPYNGDGDGIGSCDCSRCECCGAAPLECDCGRDWDGYDSYSDDEPIDDHLCNDPACMYRQYRIARKAASGSG